MTFASSFRFRLTEIVYIWQPPDTFLGSQYTKMHLPAALGRIRIVVYLAVEERVRLMSNVVLPAGELTALLRFP